MSRIKDSSKKPKKHYSAFQTISILQRDGMDEETNVALPGVYNVIEGKAETDANQK